MFEKILSERNENVHTEKRTDFGMTRLELFELLATDPKSKIEKWMVESVYRDTKKQKLKWITAHNVEVGKALDPFFDILHEYVFDESGHVQFPEKAP